MHHLYGNQIIGAYPAGNDFKVFVAPYFLMGLELFLCFKVFRYHAHPVRMFAGVVGLYLFRDN